MTLIFGWAAIGFGLVIGALAAWTLWHGAQDALAWLMERRDGYELRKLWRAELARPHTIGILRSPRRLPPVEPPDDEGVQRVG